MLVCRWVAGSLDYAVIYCWGWIALRDGKHVPQDTATVNQHLYINVEREVWVS